MNALLKVGIGLSALALCAMSAQAQDAAPATAVAPSPAASSSAAPAAASDAPATAASAAAPALDGAGASAASPAPVPDGASVQAAAAPAAAPAPLTACFAFPAKLSDNDVASFLGNPSAIFSQYGSSGLSLSNRVRGLIGSDVRTLAPMLGLAAAANDAQKAAIGSGLGRAAFACSRISPDYAAQIQLKVAEMASPQLTTAFLSASNDVQVAALGASGGGGGGGPGGLSGNGNAGPNSAGLGGDVTVPQTVATYATTGSSYLGSGRDSERQVVNFFCVSGCGGTTRPDDTSVSGTVSR